MLVRLQAFFVGEVDWLLRGEVATFAILAHTHKVQVERRLNRASQLLVPKRRPNFRCHNIVKHIILEHLQEFAAYMCVRFALRFKQICATLAAISKQANRVDLYLTKAYYFSVVFGLIRTMRVAANFSHSTTPLKGYRIVATQKMGAISDRNAIENAFDKYRKKLAGGGISENDCQLIITAARKATADLNAIFNRYR